MPIGTTWGEFGTPSALVTGGGGSGTVTSVSVVSANGFAGTVTNPTTAAAITLTTTVTGILKGNGTTISAASPGTDYTVTVTAADTSIVIGGSAGNVTVATGTLDVIAADHPPAANWSNNSHKITSLSNGTAATDAAAFGQIPWRNVTAQSTTYAANVGDYVLATAGAGGFTITLPAPAANATVGVKKVDSGAGTITVTHHSTETIDGANSLTLILQYDQTLLISDGTNWFVVDAITGNANVESIIRANSLDQMTSPAANVSWNNKRLLNLSNAQVSTDAVTAGGLADNQWAYVVSGCVWTADSSGSTLNGSMSAGTVMIKSILLTVSAITAHSFASNSDTYVDFTDAGSGAATVTFTAVANNAMSPALAGTNAYDTCRNAIISTSSVLTTGTNTINQGSQFSFTGAASAAATTVAAGSNGQSINALTGSQLSVAANSLAAAGLAKVVCTNSPAGFEAVIAYTGGGGTTTLTGVSVLSAASGSNTVTTGNAVTQVANWTVCDGLGNLINPTRPNPGLISYGTKAIGAITTTQTANFSQVATLTRRFIIPTGPSRQIKVSGNVTYASSSAAAGTTLQCIIQTISGSTATSVGITQQQVAVASDGVSFHPEGIALMAPGTYQVALILQQGAAGTMTMDATLLASSIWVELV